MRAHTWDVRTVETATLTMVLLCRDNRFLPRPGTLDDPGWSECETPDARGVARGADEDKQVEVVLTE